MRRVSLWFPVCALATVALAQDQPPDPKPAASDRERSLPPRALLEMKKHGHGPGKLLPGDLAPDFQLKHLSSEKRIAFSSFRGKKLVALVFGSYT
ncbi:MAG: hypothetical protein NZV14_19070 [Bryobacteraceae bacterium]|nr:hypothetical protein [Bryobacteraceae bacterium]MDW8380267.1 hypothetical protein [Bryobacterales bacterium]